MNDFDITSYFFDSIELLRRQGDIILHSQFVQISTDEEEYITQFLAQEYEQEGVNFPGVLPPFDGHAALWGAKTIFVASQLLMLRDLPSRDFPQLLPAYQGEVNHSAILSCDLCLRFLPDIIEKAEELDTYDGLIPLLDEHLCSWGYSGIGRRKIDPSAKLMHVDLLKSREMIILLVERVINRKAMHSVQHEIREIVKPYLDNN